MMFVILTIIGVAVAGCLVYLASCEFANITIEWTPEGWEE